ncbi:hypothetical protein BVRB_6g156450 [Beta vulgaris subsp. vulgaris]|uniref:Uncharacterized protein n=1 Tax=Beta vulgaris subsp. vulgaris TaxID=3555 RepID=A0A0J8B7Q9_BETVV|nr:hypothetical protein BVRB_6g156450 [Beta vulgaris subsp. vulgaris]
MFEKTRRRKEGKVYDRPYDDTQKKIQAMRELEALQDDQNSESHKDSFDEVMGNAPGLKRLHGLSVSRKMQKDKESSTSVILPEEVIDYQKKL